MADSLVFLVCLWNVKALLLLLKGLCESLNDQTAIYLESDAAA